MRVGVIGGNLQGVEAAYLARKAGWEVIVLDKKSAVPAAGLCDRFVRCDVSSATGWGKALEGVDLVIPALENEAALACVGAWARDAGIPFAFDPHAFGISSSKAESNRLFSRLGVPAPQPWPECGFPAVVKPSRGSGSKGVKVFYDREDMPLHVLSPGETWVVQQFIPGPSYSLEIIGGPGRYFPVQVTALEMDPGFDCKRVLAPADLPKQRVSELEEISMALAEALGLKGLMDIEAVLIRGKWKVLEIDARLPSQTPAAVYWSTGTNMIELLGEFFMEGKITSFPSDYPERSVVYEHIRVSSNILETAGEHLISGSDALYVEKYFFGADEAITNHAPERKNWIATLIVSEENFEKAWEKRNHVIENIRRQFKLDIHQYPAPAEL